MPDEFDVFLSHNSQDKPAVEEIASLLRVRRLRVWLDKDELRPGFPWQDGLEEGVRASRSVAVFVGEHELGAWQQPEAQAFLDRARRERIPVIPVLLPGCPESPQLNLFLEAMTWVDLRGGLTDEGIARLVWGITGTKGENADCATSTRPGRVKLPPAAAAGERILLVARDHEDRPLSGFRFAYQGLESLPTNRSGATKLDLPPEHRPGQQIKLHLLVPSSKRAEEWFLVNPQVNIPTGTAPAEVVLLRRSAFRQIAAEARDASRQAQQSGPAELTAEDRKRALVEAAARHGLTAEQLETALLSFAETQDPKDKGIAAYLEGEYSQAEDLLNKVAEKKESDFVETLYYLGASQFEQVKYRAAAETFRKAVALRGEDPVLLSWLGYTLHKLAKWNEAEALKRRALEIHEKSFGPEHPKLASHLNNLALLLQDTNRLGEAEPLMRRALAIDEKSFEPEHPNMAIRLNNLAQLLQATDRLAEAEPLMRRALAIGEESFGPDHPKVAICLNNLARLLQDTNRLGEAEPLMRRALAILLEFERRTGHEHPNQKMFSGNYRYLLKEMGKTDAEIETTIEGLVGRSE